MGGEYDEETEWRPIFAELISNVKFEYDPGAAPRRRIMRPTGPRTVLGADPGDCRSSDT